MKPFHYHCHLNCEIFSIMYIRFDTYVTFISYREAVCNRFKRHVLEVSRVFETMLHGRMVSTLATAQRWRKVFWDLEVMDSQTTFQVIMQSRIVRVPPAPNGRNHVFMPLHTKCVLRSRVHGFETTIQTMKQFDNNWHLAFGLLPVTGDTFSYLIHKKSYQMSRCITYQRHPFNITVTTTVKD